MTISVKTQKMLWGRAAMRCAHPECRKDLFEDETGIDDPTLVGENCHIVAESDDGPRADPSMPIEHRSRYNNLILLCRNHHKIIDAQEKKYTLDYLRKMKKDHERWVTEQLGFDASKQRDDEYYAGVVDQWEKLVDLENWRAWSSWVLGNGQPSISVFMDKNIEQLREWLLTRVWPGRYPDLEKSFHNFRMVASDFQNYFRGHSEKLGDDILQTCKFYQIDSWNPELYDKLTTRFDYHVDLVQDLMFELTRAANLVCDCVRQNMLPSYRLSEGRLLVESGPTMGLKFHQYVVQYSDEERTEPFPYPGLAKFVEIRAGRDVHFGEGREP